VPGRPPWIVIPSPKEYRALSPEAKAKIRRAILSALVEEVTEGLITGHDARHEVLAAVRGADAREPAPGSELQVYGILAREYALAASRLMMEAATGSTDVVPYGAIAALVGEAAYAMPQQGVLEWLASHGLAVLPLRPGLRCRNVRGVIDMLATQYEVLRQGLTELENQEECQQRRLHDPSRLRGALSGLAQGDLDHLSSPGVFLP
jgi:hypothetical protein